MKTKQMLDIFHLVSDSIWKSFGEEDMSGEWIEDFCGHKWTSHDGDDISIIYGGEEYSFEVFGTSIWKNDDYTIGKVYSGSGGMYCIMMSNDSEVTDIDEWGTLIEETLKEE